jgi:hypothetical protein
MLMKGFKNGKLEKLLGKEIHVLGKLWMLKMESFLLSNKSSLITKTNKNKG